MVAKLNLLDVTPNKLRQNYQLCVHTLSAFPVGVNRNRCFPLTTVQVYSLLLLTWPLAKYTDVLMR